MSKTFLRAALAIIVGVASVTCARAGTETVLYSFNGGTDGNEPLGGLSFDKVGHLFGTTLGGGAHNWGTVFKMTKTSNGWVLQTIHSFANSDGADPYGTLVVKGSGTLYGTTDVGGSQMLGTVFKLTLARGKWTESVLHSFSGGSDGAEPRAGVVFDVAGNIYGTTIAGGNAICSGGCGTVFKLKHNPDGSWTESVIYRFAGGSDGINPYGGLVIDSKGILYGTTYYGGTGSGIVFALKHTTKGWVKKTLYSFEGGSDGSNPYLGSLIFDSTGDLYGTTESGGNSGAGTVFELVHNPDGSWTEKVLHSFDGGDGYNPENGLAFDHSGNLYSTTINGGANGRGTVFELAPNSNGTWTETVVYSFDLGGDGFAPEAGVILDSSGDLYGTTINGGVASAGVVFEVVP
ncbi:MAG: choice-of-anchor tandem repeat GloVer-containing protein [Terriglobales bacterium]